MRAIVTIKLPRNPRHNPRNKKSGWCPISRVYPQHWCTDTTGSHHSYIEEGLNQKDIEEKAKAKYGHITRIELFDEPLSDGTWAYIVGLLEGRLKEMPEDVIAKQVRDKILAEHPRLKRMLDL